MRVIEMSGPGGPQVLALNERDKPALGDNEVLIDVAYAGINRPDCLQRQGLYPAPKGASDILGLEVSGIVVAQGKNVPENNVGKHVAALTNGGGYAEFVAVDHGALLPKLDNMSWAEAAAIPETLLTVWHNVFQLGGLQQDDVLLVHGGSSGIGTMAIQLAKAFGAYVVVTAGSDEKCQICRDLGADLAINYKTADFVEEVRTYSADLKGRKGADVILDMVGGEYVARNHKAAVSGGRIVQIAVLGGAKAEIDVALLMVKKLVHTGSTLRSQSDAFKAELTKEVLKNTWPLIENGQIKPLIHSEIGLEDAAKAHELMESGELYGKIVLQIGLNDR